MDEKIEIPKEIFERWIMELDAFEWDINRYSGVKDEMEMYLKENQ